MRGKSRLLRRRLSTLKNEWAVHVILRWDKVEIWNRRFIFCWSTYAQDPCRDMAWKGAAFFFQWPWEPAIKYGEPFTRGRTIVTDELAMIDQYVSLGSKCTPPASLSND